MKKKTPKIISAGIFLLALAAVLLAPNIHNMFGKQITGLIIAVLSGVGLIVTAVLFWQNWRDLQAWGSSLFYIVLLVLWVGGQMTLD